MLSLVQPTVVFLGCVLVLFFLVLFLLNVCAKCPTQRGASIPSWPFLSRIHHIYIYSYTYVMFICNLCMFMHKCMWKDTMRRSHTFQTILKTANSLLNCQTCSLENVYTSCAYSCIGAFEIVKFEGHRLLKNGQIMKLIIQLSKLAALNCKLQGG